MYEFIQNEIYSFFMLVTLVYMLAGMVLTFIGMFKRKKYYESHSASFGLWKAIGFAFYMQLPVVVVAFINSAILRLMDILAIPFGNAMETNILIENIVIILLTPIATIGWYKGFRHISKKINALAEKEAELKESDETGLVYGKDIVDGRKMMLRMYMAGMGSVVMFFLKVMFIWVIAGMWILSILGILSPKNGDI